jgi:hypothetical protein
VTERKDSRMGSGQLQWPRHERHRPARKTKVHAGEADQPVAALSDVWALLRSLDPSGIAASMSGGLLVRVRRHAHQRRYRLSV